MAGLSKSKLINWRQCPKRLWLQTYKPNLAVWNDSQNARLEAGYLVGDLARDLFPKGILIDGENLTQALSDTRAALGKRRPIFEATFEHKGVLIRADLLVPDRKGFRMTEVKSSASVKPYYREDAAIQAWVAKQAKIPLSRVEIAHIDTSFVYQGDGDYLGLLKHVDVTQEIAPLETEVPKWIKGAQATLAGRQPIRKPGSHCHDPFDCPFLNHCSPPEEHPTEFPVEILPYGGDLPSQLRAAGYADLREVPSELITKPNHRRVWRISRAGEPELTAGARKAIRALPFPRYYLDFETYQFVVPVWAGTRPYAQLPFQWSCHIEAKDHSLKHEHFLSNGSEAPLLDFATSMIKALRKRGPVIVYNAAFERTRIQELAAAFPHFAPELNAIIGRLFDLLPIAREHYYHPQMRGSWSIKAVLPTIAPELAYDDLDVANGGMAQDAFAEMMDPETTVERRGQLYNSLLKYCERDTLAMVRIANYFEGIKASTSKKASLN